MLSNPNLCLQRFKLAAIVFCLTCLFWKRSTLINISQYLWIFKSIFTNINWYLYCTYLRYCLRTYYTVLLTGRYKSYVHQARIQKERIKADSKLAVSIKANHTTREHWMLTLIKMLMRLERRMEWSLNDERRNETVCGWWVIQTHKVRSKIHYPSKAP